MNYIKAYFDTLKADRAKSCKRLYNVYERLADETISGGGKYVFDVKKANRPIEFIEKFCRHSKGELCGKPVKLELFQKAFISALFGFVDKETGNRRYREAFFYVARKNGKSVLSSCIAVYMLIADGEGGAEVYSVASKKDQAKIIFDEVHNMVRQSPELAKYLKKRKTDLYFPQTFSKMQPLGRNSDTLDGLNSHLVIIDELHCIKDRNIYEVMKQSQSARRQPLLIMTTTAGTVRECIFDDMYKYACGVADGAISDQLFLPIIYELDNKDEWRQAGAWKKANPGLGTIKKVDDIIAKVERAQNSPRDLNGILVKDFNVIQNTSEAWLNYDDIENNETFNLSDFRGCYAVGGADLSRTGDLTAATVAMLGSGGKVYVEQMYFIPADTLKKRVENEKLPYDKWHEAGLLRLCEGNTINYSDVTKWFLEIVNDYGISPAWIYYDAWSAPPWIREMQAQGFNTIATYQGFKTLSMPMQQLEADLKAKKVIYNNNPLLKWCISNTRIKADVNANIMPIKGANPKYRIDGLASLLDAYVGLMAHYNELKELAEGEQ